MPRITPNLAAVSKLGPGSLIFGETGEDAEFHVLCSKIEYKPDYKAGDQKNMLDGGALAGDAEESFSLAGDIAQTFDADSLLLWSDEHHGETLPFVFIPVKKAALKLTGKVLITRLGFGGDVKKQNDTSFEFTGLGDPKLTADNVDPDA